MKFHLLFLVFALSAFGVVAACDDDDEGDGDGDSDADGDTDADSEPDGDTDSGADGDADGDSDGDADGDSDGDADGDSDGDGDGDADSDGDSDADSDADGPTECPADMAEIPSISVCIDRYEASLGAGDVAVAIAGVLPWVEVGWPTASSACEAAGKRLCTEAEWIAGCQGTSGSIYPWGDTWENGICNDGDPDVGLETVLLNTGSLPTCEGGIDGVFDLAGNVWEWTSDCASGRCIIHGGSYRNGQTQFQCTNNDDVGGGGYGQDNLGFRCCLSL